MATVKPRELHIVSRYGAWKVSSNAVREQFQALNQGEPVFAIERIRSKSNGKAEVVYQLKCKHEGLRLGLKGHAEKRGKVGDQWEVPEEKLLDCRLGLGSKRWDFAWAQVPAHMVITMDSAQQMITADAETQRFRKFAASVLSSVFLLIALLQLFPNLIPSQPKVLYSESITIAIPKAGDLGGADTRPMAHPNELTPQEMAQAAVAPQNEQKIPKPENPKVKAPQQMAVGLPQVKDRTQISGKNNANSMPTAKVKNLRSDLVAALSSLSKSGNAASKGAAPQEVVGEGSRGDALLNSVDQKTDQKARGDSRGLRLSQTAAGKAGHALRVGESPTGVGAVGYSKGVHAALAGQGQGSVAVDLSGVNVNEGLTRDEVGAVIQKHMEEIRYCYETARVHSAVEGKVQIKFSITAVGRVSPARVLASSVGSEYLENCLLRKLTTWQFPKPRGGVTVDVAYPFVFRTIGGAASE